MTFEARLSAHALDRPTAVTVGTFDGVHIGHRKLIEKVRRLASSITISDSGTAIPPRDRGLAVAIVFRQQPRSLLQPDRRVTYIQRLEDRLAMLRACGLDVVIPVDFDPGLRSLTPREFAATLCTRLKMRHLVLGPGAAIGKDRSGDAIVLAAIGREIGFEVHTVEPAAHRGEVVSSTAVRTALADGRLEDVEGMLGRRFELAGTVESGERRGRKLGFPTANLAVEPDAALPGDGIYATWAVVDTESGAARLPAATSIGVRPTFGGRDKTVEAFLIGFDGNLCGKPLRLEFVGRLRDELKFESGEALARQIENDVLETKRRLGSV